MRRVVMGALMPGSRPRIKRPFAAGHPCEAAPAPRERTAHAARLSKTLMTLSLCFITSLITFTNVTDYSSNYPFVQHVLSMDTTFKDPDVMYRSLTRPWMWTAGYWLIIAGEGVTSLLFLVASVRMLGALDLSPPPPSTAPRRRSTWRPPRGSWCGSWGSWRSAASGS